MGRGTSRLRAGCREQGFSSLNGSRYPPGLLALFIRTRRMFRFERVEKTKKRATVP